jgi:hypothetical protein
MTQVVEWLFGCGLSIGCGLHWSAPEFLNAISLKDQIAMIRNTIKQQMSVAYIDTPYIGTAHLFQDRHVERKCIQKPIS